MNTQTNNILLFCYSLLLFYRHSDCAAKVSNKYQDQTEAIKVESNPISIIFF